MSNCYRSRVRIFYSKGAFLVLFWTTLFSTTVWLYIRMYELFFQGIQDTGLNRNFSPVLLIPLLVSAPLAGWLADMSLDNYRVFRIGSILLFSGSVLGCVFVLIWENVDGISKFTHIFSHIVMPITGYSLGLIGGLSCLVTSLQLGLDQMPDASAANISSFIAWFVCSLFLGFWIAEVSFFIPTLCTITTIQEIYDNKTQAQLTILIPVLCTSVICSTLFIFASKWLIIEPKSPQSLKIIYQVLKFAAKHKAPINRSAFTYWEENIPSRIDLGKSKYGRPFTTEQVEDVKTILKILVVLLPHCIIVMALGSGTIALVLLHLLARDKSNCTTGLLYSLTYNPWCIITLISVVYEFGVYPIIRNKLPNSLRRIGITALLALLLNSVYFTLNLISYFHPEARLLQEPWPYIVYSVLNGIAILFLSSGTLEFVCAQSPYSMRGLMTGSTNFATFISLSLGLLIFFILKVECIAPSCTVIRGSISMVLCIIGFILYCVLARWYKMRVRDEDYSPHRVIEEVYDRYLSQVR